MTESEYHIAYYSILLIFFIIGGIFRQFRNDKYRNFPFCALISISIAILIGGRSLDIGTDTHQYRFLFNEYMQMDLDSRMDYFTFGGDPIFKLVLHILGCFTDFNGILFLVSFTISILNYIFAREIVQITGYGSITVLFLAMMSSFVTWDEQVNIIRSGIGIGLFIVYLVLLYQRKIKWAMLLGLLAIGNHFSTAIFIVLSLIPYFLKLRFRTYIIVYFTALIASALGTSMLSTGIFEHITFAKAQRYTTNIESFDYETGFRFTFALYNTGFLLIALYCRKYINGFNDFLFKFYMLSSALFFLWFTIPFSNRIGTFSWTVIPAIYYLPLFAKFEKLPVFTILAVLAYGVFSCFVF